MPEEEGRFSDAHTIIPPRILHHGQYSRSYENETLQLLRDIWTRLNDLSRLINKRIVRPVDTFGLVDIPKAAEILSVSPRMIHELLMKHALAGKRIGRRVLINKEDLQQFIRSLEWFEPPEIVERKRTQFRMKHKPMFRPYRWLTASNENRMIIDTDEMPIERGHVDAFMAELAEKADAGAEDAENAEASDDANADAHGENDRTDQG